MRHVEPEMVTDYKIWLKAGPPKCCHTCEHYGVDGLCVVFFMTPPADFAATVGECADWELELPF